MVAAVHTRILRLRLIRARGGAAGVEPSGAPGPGPPDSDPDSDSDSADGGGQEVVCSSIKTIVGRSGRYGQRSHPNA